MLLSTTTIRVLLFALNSSVLLHHPNSILLGDGRSWNQAYSINGVLLGNRTPGLII